MAAIRNNLYNFFVSVNTEEGEPVLQRTGRTITIITGLAVLILGSLALASVYGAFPGIPILGKLAAITMPGAYSIVAVGATILMLGILRKLAEDHHFRQTKRGIQEAYNKMGEKKIETTTTVLSSQTIRSDN